MRGGVARAGLGLALLTLSLSAGCRTKADWVVEVVNPNDMQVAISEVEVYRSTGPGEDAQLVATAKGRASKSLSIPAIYASLREEASELGANFVVVEVGSTMSMEYNLGTRKPSLIPVPYVFVSAAFYSTSSELAEVPDLTGD